ncbi:SigB/SigF/SigG family RNA polymerase sigma factor [Streptomyces sp. NPDC001904]|uniref:SigB/SigF/SigG family RNA polymerase sigma factor n=1 Tax=Streptomyces sp. NPDC001904 TaxID=3154531 RepID=UPI00333358D1
MAIRHSHHDAPDTRQTFERLARTGSGPEHDLLNAELIEAWLPMAHRIAGRFRNKGENQDDLRQVAAVGLVKAVDRYDPERGAFESYAVPTITGELRRHFRDHAWDVRVPRRVQDLRNQVRGVRRELMDRPGRHTEPGAEEIAAECGLTLDEVQTGLEALESYSALSLDAEVGASDDEFSLADTLGENEPGYDLVTDREAAKKGFRHLAERERTILYLRFFEDMTQANIAERMGISQMHVSRLISRSCTQIRDYADAPSPDRQAA